MFAARFFLTPIAVVAYRQHIAQLTYKDYRVLYVFGIRIAYWTCDQK